MDLFRRKSVTDLQTEAMTDHSLKRALGALNLTALGIGAIIGTGIFVLTGTVAAINSGPAVVLSFVLAGVASIFAALCYSEFASLVPMAGSAYTYGYATLVGLHGLVPARRRHQRAVRAVGGPRNAGHLPRRHPGGGDLQPPGRRDHRS